MQTTYLLIPAARLLLNWTQKDLAEKAGVSIGTIHKAETPGGLLGSRYVTVEAIKGALEQAGIELIDEPGRIGVTLKR